MKNITLTGTVGDEIEISHQDGKLIVKLSEHGFAVDFTDAVIKAMKMDANAFLYAAQLIYRGDYSGEHHARARIAEVVKATFDAIKAPEKKPATANVEKKEPTAKQSVTTEKKEVEQQPKAVEEPKVADKPVATEKKATTTTTSEKKTTTTTAKKTSATSTKKSK